MSISSTTAASTADTMASIQTAVLGTVLQSAAQNTEALVNSVPQPPAPATSGSVGTRVNTYA